jgi:hypothetical protein
LSSCIVYRMKPVGNTIRSLKRPIIVVVLITMVIGLVVLIGSMVTTARMADEAKEVLKMQILASAVGDNLEEQFRKAGKYPTKLNELTFRDASVFSTLGVSRSDLQRFGYSSAGTKFKLDFESPHFRLALSGDETTGLTMEPLAAKK